MNSAGQGIMETVTEEEWVFADSSLLVNKQADARQDCSKVALFDHDRLTPQLVDSLADYQQDWIGLLQHDWKLELHSLNLLGIKIEEGRQHWIYTGCLQIAGLGRVRVVACFKHPQCFEHCAAFVTNRLDWSPRRIINHWLQQSSASALPWQNALL